MAIRSKRSVSLPPELAREIERAAAREHTTFSAWLSSTAARQLKLDAGRRGLAEWEREHGALTPKELAEGEAIARRLLGKAGRRRTRRVA